MAQKIGMMDLKIGELQKKVKQRDAPADRNVNDQRDHITTGQ